MGKKAKNMVIKGDYMGKYISPGIGKYEPYINLGLFKKVILSKETVESYELLNNSQGTEGGIVSGAIGEAFLGPVGRLAGMPKVVGINLVAIKMKDGKKFLAEIDDERYRSLVQWMYDI